MKRVSTALMWGLVLLACLAPVLAQQNSEVTIFVLHGATGDLVADVQVMVTPGDVAKKTDLDGMVQFALLPGTYDVRFSKDGFLEKVVKDLIAEDGSSVDKTVTLNPEGLEVELEDNTVEVVASSDQSSIESLLVERKSAATLSDSIGRQEMSLNGGSDASDVMQRVTGVSIVDNKFVYVRGLGERYSATQLNGSVLPSTQPDKKVVPMDLFPASLLENIQTDKSYSPDKPGEFAGGVVKVNTIDFPTGPTFRVSYGTTFGTNTTFKSFADYPGGDYEFFGFDDGSRDLPDILPPGRIVPATRFSEGFTPEELQRFGRAFSNVWSFDRGSDAIPDQKFNLIGGNTFGNLGVVVALNHGTSYHNQHEIRRNFSVGADEDIKVKSDYEFDLSTQSTNTAATANFAYRLSSANRFLFRNFYTHASSDEARAFEGFDTDFGTDLRNIRLRFEEESIYSGQVGGEHFFQLLGDNFLKWTITRSRSTLEQPDLRETLYEFNPGADQFEVTDESQSGFRQFNNLAEVIWEPQVDFSSFFYGDGYALTIKAGALYRDRERDFSSRRFRLVPLNTSGIDLTAAPEDVFAPENIRPGVLQLREETRNTDTYEAFQINRSAYGMLDLTLGPWRFVGGVRVENDDQEVVTFDLFNPAFIQETSRISNTDVLPSINVVYRLNAGMNVRGSFSETVNRPEFRELSPFDFTDVVGGRSVVGNPDLVRAKIRNYDVRWEWFPSPLDLISASFFYKTFENPIERVVRAQANLLTSYDNADTARNFGFELDFRRGLGFLTRALENFSVNANYTFVDSEVDIVPDANLTVTSLIRPLQGQSRHIFNAIFEYANPNWGTSARALLNFQGDRISDVGSFGIPDIIESGRPSLDTVLIQPLGASRKWSLKFSAENLLNNDVEYTQGDRIQRLFRTGRKFGITISYSFFGE
ncbi:MAG TPA: TonB-dependent receptor [Acidobacteriota bacterium]|nr:TonB-dependent receptor [Acidobacteriota bacterium]